MYSLNENYFITNKTYEKRNPHLSNSNDDFISNFIEKTTNISKIITKHKLSLLDSYRLYFKEFESINEIAEQNVVHILKECEWPITPSLPRSFRYKIILNVEDSDFPEKAVNELFYDHFSENNFENLEMLVNNWESEKTFKEERIKIIRDCLSVLKIVNGLNPSNLAIPTLIAQIDGIRTEFMRKSGLVQQNKWKSWYENQTLNQDPLLKLANNIFIDVLWENSWYGDEPKTSIIFNRHKIMHGEYTNYGSIYNTIRAFLILDFLAILIKDNYSYI